MLSDGIKTLTPERNNSALTTMTCPLCWGFTRIRSGDGVTWVYSGPSVYLSVATDGINTKTSRASWTV